MAINKLTEQRERDRAGGKGALTKGRIVFIGAMQNDLWENSNSSGQPSAINSQKWRKEIINLVKVGCSKASTSQKMVLFLRNKNATGRLRIICCFIPRGHPRHSWPMKKLPDRALTVRSEILKFYS